MTENIQNSVPEIRFNGFTNDWVKRKLGDVYTERNERGNDSLKILSVSIHHGASNEELDSKALGKKVRRSEDKSLYKHVYWGDLVLNMMRAWQGAIGVVKSEGMVSPAYITAIPSSQIYPLFMDYYLRRDEAISQMDQLSYGVTDFRKRLYWDSFIKVSCHIPSVSEQEKITEFFSQLDDTITLHKRKLDRLRELKKGYLQQLFPQAGVREPRVRFSGFTGDWNERKIGEICNATFGGGTPSTSNDDFWNGDLPWLQSSDLTEHDVMRIKRRKHISVKGVENSSAKLVPANSIAIVTRVGVGKICLIPFQYATSQDFISLSDFNINTWFGVYMIYSKLQKELNAVQGTSIKGVTKDELLNKTISVPPSLSEQTIIGNFFYNLDEQITAHTAKLEQLRQLKAAYLQKMFI